MAIKLFWIHPQLRDYRVPLFDMLNKRFDITFYFLRSSENDGRYKHVIKKSCLPKKKMPYNINFGYILTIAKEIKKSDIVICSHVGSPLNLIGLLQGKNRLNDYGTFPFISKFFGKKTIVWVEKWYLDNKYYKNFADHLNNICYNFADAFIAHGKSSHTYCKHMRIPQKKIFIAPHCSIDQKRHCSGNLKKELSIEGKDVILFVGRIIDLKGLDILIMAFKKLEEKIKDVFLLIGGTGKVEPDCRRLSKEIGVKNIRFLGKVKSENVSSLYEACDVFVLPSCFREKGYEGWGLVVNEAMSMGKPIVTTNAVGAAPDLVENGVNGFVVENKNVNALYEALLKILSDNKLKRNMGENSRKIFEDFNDFGKMFEGFKKAIEYAYEES